MLRYALLSEVAGCRVTSISNKANWLGESATWGAKEGVRESFIFVPEATLACKAVPLFVSSFVRFVPGKMAFNDMSKRNGV
jgi:hypothetical protein